MKLSLCIASTLLAASAALAATPAAPAKSAAPSLPKLTAEQVVERHVTAIGGESAWRGLQTLVTEGEMEAGGKPAQQLPYVLKQKRGHKSRLEIQFNGQTAVQIYDGSNGWKVRPFTNRTEVETMSASELAESAKTAVDDLDGPFINMAQKGIKVALVGTEVVRDHAAYELKLTAKDGTARHAWIDGQSFMLIKMEGEPRRLDMTSHPVSIYYSDFHADKGLTFAHEQETVVEQAKAPTAKRSITKVHVNEPVDEASFTKPNLPDAQQAQP